MNPNQNSKTRQAEGLLTLPELADLIGVSRRTVNAWAARKMFPVIRLGHRTVRVRRNDFEKAMEKLTERAR